MCTVRHRNEKKDYFSLDVLNYLTNKTTLTFFNENYPKKLRYQIFCFIMLVPNCPGAKLSVLTMLVPNCPFSFLDDRLLAFLVPKCPFLLSWCKLSGCQIVLLPFVTVRINAFLSQPSLKANVQASQRFDRF